LCRWGNFEIQSNLTVGATIVVHNSIHSHEGVEWSGVGIGLPRYMTFGLQVIRVRIVCCAPNDLRTHTFLPLWFLIVLLFFSSNFYYFFSINTPGGFFLTCI
jgi:hypothetical protein